MADPPPPTAAVPAGGRRRLAQAAPLVAVPPVAVPLIAVVLIALLSACTQVVPGSPVQEVVVEGLRGPTQLAHHPDGRLLVAEIGAGEGTATGTITAIDLANPEQREVLADGLDTPTGVTVADGRLWIMERTRLVTAPLEGGSTRVVFDQMPSNGRSNGTLLALADGDLLFDTSGRRQGFDAAPGSGTLWRLDPTAVTAAGAVTGLAGTFGTPVLTGMKHAYAAVELPDGSLAVTEMSDGRYDGEPAPDEVVLVATVAAMSSAGAASATSPATPAGSTGTPPPTGGWPRCIGEGQAVEEFEGSAQLCEATVPSLAVFAAGATPTGIVVDPTAPDRLLVALWNRDQVVSVPLDRGRAAPSSGTVVAQVAGNPQHLLVDGDRVLVSGHRDGVVIALRPG